jgi:hypothetical protein
MPEKKKYNLLKKFFIKLIKFNKYNILSLKKQKSKRFNILTNKVNIENETIINI